MSVLSSRAISRALLLAFAAFFCAVLAPGGAQADVGDRFGKLTQLRRDVTTAKGPMAYVALRKLWHEWDRGDPVELEELLLSLTEEKTLAPPLRAYAGLLEAYARRRRGDLEGAGARITKLGFVSRWMIAGAFDNEGRSGSGRDFGPETDEAPTLTKTFDGKERKVSWRVSPAAAPFGWLDFGGLIEPTQKVCAYAFTYVKDDKLAAGASRTISVWAGSAGAMRIFWNGEEIIKDDKYRSLDSDRFGASVTLKGGTKSRLLVKVCGDEDPPMVSVRLGNDRGEPDPRITTDVDGKRDGGEIAKGKSARPASHVEGPVQAFERLIKGNDPAMLEGFARYMVMTQSDDPTEHRARDLSRKAAEASPTVMRLLLAGELAENRNQRAIWIERAEALLKQNKAPSVDDQIAVLLARASHARAGVNWRDAVPYFDRVLALDPDDVTAVLQRFELYSEANLRETALAFLQRAVARRPRSVALVRATVGALRQLERTVEAAELEERYAQLRFDDVSFVRGHIDLAIAQRDPQAAERWIDRLVALNPDSAPLLSTAAQCYGLMGNRTRSIALYKKALDLSPENTDTMQKLAEAYAISGRTEEQVKLLRQVLTIRPQSKEVREYLAHLEPAKPRPDEKYARPSSEFLAKRGAPAKGEAKRTLVNLQVTTVFPNGLASRFHQIVFQPLTDRAATDGREYGFSFEADAETVQLRGARVYRANGQVDQAVESGEGPVNNPSIAMYTSARAFYVRFPRLSPGDVVELLYRVEDVSARNAFADYFGEVVYMQSSESIARSEYVLITPAARTFYFNKPVVPGVKSTREDAGAQRIYHFTAENVPAIEPEPNQPPYSEILGHVHVSTYKDWNDMARWYWGLVKEQFVADDEVRRRVAEVTKGLKTDQEKIRAVYDYVVQKTRYVALEFGIHGFKPYRCAQIFARGFGDCKDKATLIVTMLKELGIPATIVILRTGQKGDFETFPASLAPFDHAIAYVPSLDLYLDGTAENTGSTELPAMDRNALAIQINEGKPKLVHLPDPAPTASVTSRKVDVTMSADGKGELDWRVDVSGVSAPTWRHRYQAEATRKQRLQEDLASEFAGLELTSMEGADFGDIESKVWLKAKAKVPQFARKEGDRLSVPAGPDDHMVRDYATLSQRKLDLRLNSQSTTESDWTLRIPPGARVVNSPVKTEGQSPFGSYRVDVENVPAGVHVKTTLTMSKTRISAKEYPAFRAFCEAADRALGQRLTVSVK
jgi:tetratricopeptide (TPR) repeat protein